MEVSFIIPIYKVEKYLDECISSILNQTFTDFEIILVDDGSPDNCPEICDIWAKKDSRVRVLHKSNGGLSDARNAGIEAARGDYLIFVDGDDFWVSDECLNNIMDTLEQHPGCSFINFNCSYYYSTDGSYRKWKEYPEELCRPVDRNTALSLLTASGTIPMSACLKVIDRNVFSNGRAKFIKGIHCEDIPWFIDLLEASDKCVFTNLYIYAYRQNVNDSISASFGEKSFNDLLNIIETETAKAESRNFSAKALEALYSFLAYEFCILLAGIKSLPENLRKDSREKLMKYRWLLKHTVNPKVRLTYLASKILGIRLTENILNLYMKIH